MKKINITKTQPKFLIFRNGAIGNTLVATPFIRNLRENFPDAFIAIIVDEVGLALLKNNPCIDKFLKFNRKSDSIKYQLKLIKELRALDVDVSFHLRTGIRNELLAFLSRIPVRIGTNLKGSFQFLTHKASVDTTNGHAIYNTLSLLKVIPEIQIKFYFPELYVDIENKKRCDTFLLKHGVNPQNYIIVHPTGKTIGQVNWNLSFYQKLIKSVQEFYDIPMMVIGIPNEEQEIRKYFTENNKLILLMELDIGFKSEIIRQASLFIGNDSGPAHIAEAWNVPKVVIYRNDPANFKKWRSLRQDVTLTIFQDEINNDAAISKVITHLSQWIKIN